MSGVYPWIIPALWISWGVYWKLAAGNVKPTTRHESFASRMSHAIPLMLAVLLFLIRDQPGHLLFGQIWPRSPETFWGGVALIVAGFAFTVWARLVLGRNWSATVTIKADHELIQSGPYRWVRHPIYTGLLVAFAGSALSLAEWRGLLSCVLLLLAFVIKLRIEERWMTEVFGPAYEQYRQRVNALIPFVW
jgi:protein-S-isoprenylcysteine O-methyltransferase Ste14